MNEIKLTPRLLSVANMVPDTKLLADVGTDHAYIPIYLVKNGIAENAVASDVVRGPVEIAQNNVKSYSLDHKIQVKMAYGLKAAEGADTIVIAGMGGKLISEIIHEDINIAKSAKRLVLQPMTCEYDLRKFLHKNGFSIEKETIAEEDDKIYIVMTVLLGLQRFEDEFHYYIGKDLFDKKHPLLPKYLRKKANVIKKRINGMEKSSNPSVLKECETLKKLYDRIIKEVQTYGKSI